MKMYFSGSIGVRREGTYYADWFTIEGKSTRWMGEYRYLRRTFGLTRHLAREAVIGRAVVCGALPITYTRGDDK